MDNIKLLSVVMPAFKQEKTIVKDVESLDKILSSLPFDHEIIVVVDGMLDKTYERVKSIELRNLKVLGYERNLGKGNAVKMGMLEAKGDVVGFIDAGMDIDPTGISLLLDLMSFHNADIVVGSKLHPESQVDYPYYRKILTWGYRTLTQLLFNFDVKDTQVGLKFFRKKVVREVFPKLLVKQFAFDVEILAVSEDMGFTRIYEGPIKLDFIPGSLISANLWKQIALMIWDTFAVFYRLKIMHYYES